PGLAAATAPGRSTVGQCPHRRAARPAVCLCRDRVDRRGDGCAEQPLSHTSPMVVLTGSSLRYHLSSGPMERAIEPRRRSSFPPGVFTWSPMRWGCPPARTAGCRTKSNHVGGSPSRGTVSGTAAQTGASFRRPGAGPVLEQGHFSQRRTGSPRTVVCPWLPVYRGGHPHDVLGRWCRYRSCAARHGGDEPPRKTFEESTGRPTPPRQDTQFRTPGSCTARQCFVHLCRGGTTSPGIETGGDPVDHVQGPALGPAIVCQRPCRMEQRLNPAPPGGGPLSRVHHPGAGSTRQV